MQCFLCFCLTFKHVGSLLGHSRLHVENVEVDVFKSLHLGDSIQLLLVHLFLREMKREEQKEGLRYLSGIERKVTVSLELYLYHLKYIIASPSCIFSFFPVFFPHSSFFFW